MIEKGLVTPSGIFTSIRLAADSLIGCFFLASSRKLEDGCEPCLGTDKKFLIGRSLHEKVRKRS